MTTERLTKEQEVKGGKRVATCCGYMLGIWNWVLVLIIGVIANNMKSNVVAWFVNMLDVWLASV